MYLKTKTGKKVDLLTDEEDAAVVRESIEDDTVWSEKQLSQFKPIEDSALPESIKEKVRRGRPKSLLPKKPISIRFSSEVIKYFKASGKGWQTRMDDVLREYVAKH